jgi:solute carrier family 13 (sodium-dependent dicarboxylate transporter), member 2/3/5
MDRENLPQKAEAKKRLMSLIYFAGSLLLALFLTWMLREPSFSDSQVYTLFLLFFATGLWVTEAIPPFAVSLFIMAFLVFALGNKHFNSEPEKIDRYVNTFSSSIIWLFMGGFFISAAMTKTGIDEKLLRFTLRISGTKPTSILIALMTTTMIGSMLMSNTATSAMIVAAMAPLLGMLGKSGTSKALLLGVSIAATTGGIGTVIGSPPNAVAAGILEKRGLPVDFLTWMLYGMPIALFLTYLSCWALIKIYMKNPETISLDLLKNSVAVRNDISPAKRRIVMVVIIVTVLMWLTSSIHGITVSAVSAIPIVILTLTGVLGEEDMRKLPWDTLFLVAGSLSLGEALESTGILNLYAVKLKALNIGGIALIFILAYMTSVFANIMSNVGASAVLIPFGMAIIPGAEKELAMSIGISASMALFLLVSAPPNAIVYSTGLIEQKDFRLGGVIVGIIGPVITVLWVMFIGR